MRTSKRIHSPRPRRGAAMVAVMILGATLATLSLSFLATNVASSKSRRAAKEEFGATLVAEAGLSEAIYALEQGQSADLGSPSQPIEFGGGEFWVEAEDLGDGMTSIVSTGIDGRAGARLELVVRSLSDSFFQWGAFGDEDLELASNARTDSYDSGAGTYASQAVNGSGNNMYAGEDGDVGSNQNVLLRQNSDVHGDAICGPAGAVTVMGNADVSGSTLPAADLVVLPPIDVPVIASSGDLIVPGGDTVVVASGDHAFGVLDVGTGAELQVFGPARLVFDSFELKSNSNLVVDASGGPVEIFVRGDFIMNSNTMVASVNSLPGDISVNLESDNVVGSDVIAFDSNSSLYGTIYAPNAAIEIDSNFELFGSLVAKSLLMRSNSRLHYDTALGGPSGNGSASFETLSWRELSYSPNGH